MGPCHCLARFLFEHFLIHLVIPWEPLQDLCRILLGLVWREGTVAAESASLMHSCQLACLRLVCVLNHENNEPDLKVWRHPLTPHTKRNVGSKECASNECFIFFQRAIQNVDFLHIYKTLYQWLTVDYITYTVKQTKIQKGVHCPSTTHGDDLFLPQSWGVCIVQQPPQ